MDYFKDSVDMGWMNCWLCVVGSMGVITGEFWALEESHFAVCVCAVLSIDLFGTQLSLCAFINLHKHGDCYCSTKWLFRKLQINVFVHWESLVAGYTSGVQTGESCYGVAMIREDWSMHVPYTHCYYNKQLPAGKDNWLMFIWVILRSMCIMLPWMKL